MTELAQAAREIDDEALREIDELLRCIQAAPGKALHEALVRVCALGDRLLAYFYGIERFRSRSPKDTSLRDIWQRLGKVRAAAPPELSRAIRTNEFVTRHGGVGTFEHLAPGHVALLLPLDADPDRQRQLLQQVESEGLSVRALRRRIRPAPGEEDGQHPHEAWVLRVSRRTAPCGTDASDTAAHPAVLANCALQLDAPPAPLSHERSVRAYERFAKETDGLLKDPAPLSSGEADSLQKRLMSARLRIDANAQRSDEALSPKIAAARNGERVGGAPRAQGRAAYKMARFR